MLACISIQINGGFGFDFSVYEGDDQAYRDGLKLVAERIIETGVTALVPTIITQGKSLYPKLLHLLRPWSPPGAAHLLGWHVEGPFLHLAKRGVHSPPLIIPASDGFKTFESTYSPENLADAEDWLMGGDIDEDTVGVRIITAAPEVEGVMEAISTASKRGICFNIGHSICSTEIATAAVQNGARCITHLFNAMPQLHHRDPSIIGLLGSSPYTPSVPASDFAPLPPSAVNTQKQLSTSTSGTPRRATPPPYASEAFDEIQTPPQTPAIHAAPSQSKGHKRLQSKSLTRIAAITPTSLGSRQSSQTISILTGLISLMAHGFYCWRIRVMGRSWYIPIFVMMTSLVQCIFLGLGTMSSGLLGGPVWFTDIWMFANFVCDLIITIETTRLLFRRGATSSFKGTRGLVRKLIKLTIETGAVTTAAMLLQFLLSWSDQLRGFYTVSEYDGLWVPNTRGLQLSVFYSISRLYANCLLATLNARLVISKDSTHVHQVSTVLFDVPPPSGVSERPADNYINATIGQSQLEMGSLMDTGDDSEFVSVEGIEKPNHEGVSEV
ncbi:hypothetical protein PAXINDRAFT_97488 [Paxillus involutus ATCC 200175]|nr:hypothetical protein PAXINDRAFT_97488 [Paxillus involutus ATCC 200175]